MKRLILLLFGSFFCFSAPLQACINEEGDIDGKVVEEPISAHLTKTSYGTAFLYDRLRSLQAEYDSAPDPKVLNKMAATCMRLGDPNTAREYLIQLIEDSVYTYAVMANLGTAYELNGQPDSALYWIHQAVILNPQSHHGSEWIHEQILRYKIAKGRNSAYSANSSVLSLDFGTKDLPVNTYNMDLAKLKNQMEYQINERLYFVDSTDEVMALLLFDYANVLALETSLKDALDHLKLAKEFGLKTILLNARLDRLAEMSPEDLEQKATAFEGEEVSFTEKKVNVYLIAGILALIAVGGVYLVLRSKGQA